MDGWCESRTSLHVLALLVSLPSSALMLWMYLVLQHDQAGYYKMADISADTQTQGQQGTESTSNYTHSLGPDQYGTESTSNFTHSLKSDQYGTESTSEFIHPQPNWPPNQRLSGTWILLGIIFPV